MSDQGAGQSGAGEGEGSDKGAGSSEQKYKVVVSGQEMEVPLTELLNGYQRQADYTKKTQEVSAREKKMNEAVEARAMELYLEALKKGDSSDEAKAKADRQAESESVDPQRLKALEDRIAKSEADRLNAEAERELDTHIKTVKQQFPKADVDKILIEFYKNADESTDVAKFFADKASEQHKAAEAYEQKVIDDYVKRRSERALGGMEKGASTPPTGKAPVAAKTFEEARERAEQRIAAVRGD